MTGCFGTAANARETVRALHAEGVNHLAFVTRFGGLAVDSAHDSLQLIDGIFTA
tara:strand:+ start:337 stop:498 length:162 start_codon:yes stop_codon:yes gene_type:complete